jgi:hypothetical protein
MQCNARMKALFTRLDAERREVHLKHPNEGVAFVTYEIHCTHRNNFELHEFPFDTHALNIVVRLDRKDQDPMRRTIIPIGHDKAFFVSGRVPPMVDYHLARNMDWKVTREAMEYGGLELIQAAAIVRRKPGYFVRNYVVIVFLITSSSFAAFMAGPDNMEGRSGIIFMIMLTVIAFKYSGGDVMPKVPYSTILATYITLNFYIVLLVGVVAFGFSMVCVSGGSLDLGDPENVNVDIGCSRMPGRWYNMPWIPEYDPVVETSVGMFLVGVWMLFNYLFWKPVWDRIQLNLKIIDDVDIGWMSYKATKKPGMPRAKRFAANILVRTKAEFLATEAENARKAEEKKKAAAAEKKKAAAAEKEKAAAAEATKAVGGGPPPKT